MAILFFDGFDTYGVLPAGETQVGINASVPVQAAGWTGTGIAVATGTRHQIVRPPVGIEAEPRNWLSSTAGATIDATQNPSFLAGTIGRFNVETPLNVKAIVGFKLATLTVPTAGAAYCFVGRFALGKRFVDVHYHRTNGTIGLTTALPADGTSTVWVSPTVQATANTAASTGANVANYLGTAFSSTWTIGTVNTVEVEIDPVNDLATCWINNIFVGAVVCPEHDIYDEGTGATLIIASAKFSNTNSHGGLNAITDLYFVNGEGSINNSRLGKVKVLTRLPTADVQAEFDRPAGAATNSEVAAQVPPSASNYLTGTNIDDTDLYSSTNFDFSNEAIIASAITVSGFKTDPAGNNVAPVLSVGGTVYELDGLQLPVGQVYGTRTVVSELNPATGLPFTKTALDATNFGVRVTSAE